MEQVNLFDAEYQGKTRKTRREIVLAYVCKLVSCGRLEKSIPRSYPKSDNGWRPYPLSTICHLPVFISTA